MKIRTTQTILFKTSMKTEFCVDVCMIKYFVKSDIRRIKFPGYKYSYNNIVIIMYLMSHKPIDT